MKDLITSVGVVVESLSNDRYKVRLDNGVEVTAYPGGRLRIRHIRVLVGDRVRVALSPYDLSCGRIERRL